MISNSELQLAYNDLYVQVRKYIWDFYTVNLLAELEVQTYTTCPDMNKLRSAFHEFKQSIFSTLKEDEDLRAAVDAFEELIDSDDATYAKLTKVNEVIEHEDI